MGVFREEDTNIPHFLVNLLQRLMLDPEDLARLLNLHPSTVDKWISGQTIDLGCAYVLLDLLWDHPEEVLYLLGDRERLAHAPGPSWSRKIASIRSRLGVTTEDLIAILQTSRDVLARYESGKKEPASCYAVLIDLLYRHPERMVQFLAMPEEAEEEDPWTKKRIQELTGKLGMTTAELAELLGVMPVSVRGWIAGTAQPGACTALLLDLLYWEPRKTVGLIESADPGETSAWTGPRVRAVRESMGFNGVEFTALLGVSYDTLRVWESEGLPEKTRCPIVLYSILEKYPKEMKRLLVKLSM